MLNHEVRRYALEQVLREKEPLQICDGMLLKYSFTLSTNFTNMTLNAL